MVKIWGISFSLIGDLIMSLPQLNYFKNKYKNIYVYFVIHKKISYCAPLFFNNPLIDKILISGEWSSFNNDDYNLASSCDIVTTKIDHNLKKILDRKHSDTLWYNKRTCIEETAIMSGISDLNNYTSVKERQPKLTKWFDPGFEEPQKKGAYSYKKQESKKNKILSKSLSIWPFAGYGRSKNRNPDEIWWSNLIRKFIANKIHVYHFGYFNEPIFSNDSYYYHNLTKLSFFEQIKLSLGTKLTLGTDSGSLWVLSAYSHPTITLLTNWYGNHNENLLATLPINENGKYIFKNNGFENLSIEEVYNECINNGVTAENIFNKFNLF